MKTKYLIIAVAGGIFSNDCYIVINVRTSKTLEIWKKRNKTKQKKNMMYIELCLTPKVSLNIYIISELLLIYCLEIYCLSVYVT